MPAPLDYAAAGVDYDPLDAFKRRCQRAAERTKSALDGTAYREPPNVRGESAYLLEADDHYLAHVEEGLGTKNLVADALGDARHYRAVGVDVVATIVNDLVTCGARPVSVAMHAAVGDAAWFADEARAGALADGFADGCLAAGAVWGGGETPALRGVVEPKAAVLAGSAVGVVRPKASLLHEGNLQGGERIVFLASTGVQTNGLTLCRALADRLPDGYATRIGGQTYGEALLAPSAIYARFVRLCQERAVPLRYVVHVTGHGWRKLMRPRRPFVYEVADAREPPALFDFIARHAELDARAMYGTFNMGVGFAAYVAPEGADAALAAARDAGHEAWIAGTVRDAHGRKAVEVPALGLTFDEASLSLR